MPVDVIRLDKSRQGFSALYRSDTTRYLDEKFGLDGSILTEEEQSMLCAGLAFSMADEYTNHALKRFFGLAAQAGHFAGVPLEELPENARPYVRSAINDRMLGVYSHEGIEVVEPSNGCETFADRGRIRR